VKIIVAILLIVIPFYSYAECLLKVRITDFKPLYYQDTQGKWQGVAVEVTQALFKEADCEIQFVTMPWKRALYLLEHGGLDVLLNMSRTEEREIYTDYIGPMLDENQVMIVKNDSQHQIAHLDDIKNLTKRIGIQRGVYYGAAFMKKMRTDQRFSDQFEYGDQDSNTEKLKKGRILGMIHNQYTASYRLKHLYVKGAFKQHPFIFHDNDVFFGFSKKGVSGTLRKRFEQAFSRLSAKGVLAEIALKYR
jgi:ABC-type amino acid transport substrate-binding protein